MAKVFFSYSHKDEELRDELETHLSMLQRDGSITTWHDRRIAPGEYFAEEIDANLESAEVILLLVSAYFIASDYCYEIEMQRALDKHERGEAQVIPVILRPCDWKAAPFGELMALPPDGKPVTQYPDLHEGFTEVVKAIRATLSKPTVDEGHSQRAQSPAQGKTIPAPEPGARSSNLRVRKEFTQRERDAFLEDGFEYMAKFFENSLHELSDRNPEVEGSCRRQDATHFSAVIYYNGERRAECKIWLSSETYGNEQIRFSHSAARGDNSYNESLSTEDDGYTLFLKPMSLQSRHMREDDPQLTHQGAAEYFWAMLIEPLQR